VWEWDGTDWTRRLALNNPPPRGWPTLAFDAGRDRLVMFSGWISSGLLRDTWEYGPVHPASYSAYGTGCRGSTGVPALAPTAGLRPWVRDNFALEIGGVPSNGTPFVLLGYSKTSWGGLNLPMDLTPLGMTGCSLLASGQVLLVPRRLGPTWVLDLPIPDDAGLLGAPFFNQAFVLDPPANRAGLSASNGGEGRIGAR
jgi:hypothetical protein